MSEIRQALAAGKEVITHTDPVTVPGWQGAGYIIMDPATGDAAYKIGGGKDRGYLGIFGFPLALIGLVGVGLGASASLVITIALIATAASIIKFLIISNPCGDVRYDVNLSLNAGIAVAESAFGLLGRVGVSISTAIVSWIFSTGVTSAINKSCN